MEELGADDLLRVRLAGDGTDGSGMDDNRTVVARTEGRRSPAPGHQIWLRFQPEDVFTFHPETGARLAG